MRASTPASRTLPLVPGSNIRPRPPLDRPRLDEPGQSSGYDDGLFVYPLNDIGYFGQIQIQISLKCVLKLLAIYMYRAYILYTVSHNYGNPYEKWNISVARPHLWLQLGMVKPEIILCETVLNLSTLNTLTYLLTNILTSLVSRSLMVSVGVSALGTTSIHFIESGVKVNGQYYREDLY